MITFPFWLYKSAETRFFVLVLQKHDFSCLCSRNMMFRVCITKQLPAYCTFCSLFPRLHNYLCYQLTHQLHHTPLQQKLQTGFITLSNLIFLAISWRKNERIDSWCLCALFVPRKAFVWQWTRPSHQQRLCSHCVFVFQAHTVVFATH